MTAKKNELRKVFNGRFYEVFYACNPDYKKAFENATELTDEEYECVSEIVDKDMRLHESYAYTEEVFGEPAYLYIDFD